jgi:hypothetical protein
MVASAALVEFNRSDLCKGTRSCSIISFLGSAVIKRASGVSSGILVDQNHWAAKKATAQASSLDAMALGGTNSCNRQRFPRQGRSGRGLEEQFEMVACPQFEPTILSLGGRSEEISQMRRVGRSGSGLSLPRSPPGTSSGGIGPKRSPDSPPPPDASSFSSFEPVVQIYLSPGGSHFWR